MARRCWNPVASSCGSCIDVCPVGALVESPYKWEKAVDTVSTTCPQCPVGCQLKLEVNRRGRVIRAIPDLEAEANRGQACFKGKFGLEFVNSRSRLRNPLIRRDGVLEEATWEEAIALVAEKLGVYRGDSFAAIASYRGTTRRTTCYRSSLGRLWPPTTSTIPPT